MATEEDDDDDAMTFSSVVCGVSLGRREDNDECSVDIYDGLDNIPVVSESLAAKATPAGSSLDLFDEILIAEGTAKEASYNELQAEHEKCLQQLEELTKKLQEIQEQNSTLQNENQSLKKNISSLIKTARVEIHRKDEEISNLQRRLLAFTLHQKASGRTYFAAPMNNERNLVGPKKNKCKDLLPENNPKTDPGTKPVAPKDVPRNSSDKERGVKEIRNDSGHSKENGCRNRNKGPQTMGRITDGKLPVNPVRLYKDSKNSNLKSSLCSEQRNDTFSSSLDKQPLNDRLPSKTECSGNARSEKSQNVKQKHPKTQNKDDSGGGQKTSPSERTLKQEKRKGNDISSPPKKIPSAQKLRKDDVEDKKVKDGGDSKNRGAKNHEFRKRKLLSPSPPSSHKKHKRSYSKEESSKREFESRRSKSERHQTEGKRKNKGVTLGESKKSQTERTDSKERSQKTAKVVNKGKDCTTREQNQPFPSPESTKVAGGSEKRKPAKVRRDEDRSKSKDLKLSFMQKLNLTLSPAKKQTGELKLVGRPTSGCDGEISGKLTSASAAKQKNPLSVPIPDSPVPPRSKPVISVSETKVGTESLTEIRSTESSKETSDLRNSVRCELVDNLHVNHDIGEAEETLRLPSIESPLNQDTLPDDSFNGLEIVDFDSYSVIDEISGTDSDSLTEVEDAGNCEGEIVVGPPGKENSLPKLVSQDVKGEPGVSSGDMSVTDQKPCNSKLSCLDQGNPLEKLCDKGVKSVPLARDADPVSVDDDNSVLSVDLNHMRCIPKAISPLNSPMRPLAEALRGKSTSTGSVKSYNTGLMPESAAVCPVRILSSELNKENQKPFGTDRQVFEMGSQPGASSDELEEGEIVSDDDENNKLNSERNSEHGKEPKGKPSSERSSLISSPHNQKPKPVFYNGDKGKMASGKNSKEKPRTGTVMFSKETKKNNAVKTDCLEKIVHIIAEPSTTHEFVQMLKAVRKQVRKSYMKFKVQFPIQHFHRIIDSAISKFTSLVKYLNFSKMSKSNETLKLNLCEAIESRLKRIKKNGAIDHLFEQQQPDMKKKLWKLVDEHLDNLFDKIKKILLNLCNLINSGNENGDGKPNKRIKESPKCLIGRKTDWQKPKKQSLNVGTQKAKERVLPRPAVDDQLSRRSPHDTNKTDAQKKMGAKGTSSYTGNAKHPQTKVELVKEKSVRDTESALKTEKLEKEGLLLVENSRKSDVSCGPLTEQQMSGLTFNLVNDAQMGEMFKSLLQGSDFSEKNNDFMDENQWEFRTPEKHLLSGQSCGNDTVYETEESLPKETQIESRVLDGIKWPVVSPERDSTFLTRLPMPVDPDILDENCMFDVPSSPALKKSEGCVLEKPKSLVSSILLEDLAVSLTIPSPLKSDAHLSFLKPGTFGSVPEDVLSAHFSEDAHLEEEDASEQDIHLALESDNSSSKSSCSSSWAPGPEAPGFPHCRSLPMQAVIMERSNDHFIVKIRCAVPSTSPPLDQASLVNDSVASFTDRENDGSVFEARLDTLNPKEPPLEEVVVSKEQNYITDSEDKVGDNAEKKQAPSSFETTKELSLPCKDNRQVPDLSESQQESNSSAPENTLAPVNDLLSSARREQDCRTPEPLRELSGDTGQHQGTGLIDLRQVLCDHADPEEASDLPDPRTEAGKPSSSSVSFTEPSNKSCNAADVPDAFKLPQARSLKVLQKGDGSCAAVEQLPISSAVLPLVDVFSSEGQFAIGADLANETPVGNEVDSWDFTAESASNAGIGSFHKEGHEPAGRCTAGHLLTRDVDAVTDSAAELPDKPTAGGDFERKTALGVGGLICGKGSKKRKRETEETSGIKVQRKNSEPSCKKNGKSSKKSKDVVSVTKSSSSKKTAPIEDDDSWPSPSSGSRSNLYAKNIVKKKGEVIVSWTRNDDREILLECQKKGPSENTFFSVAARLNKSSNQVEERFRQLVKLFNMSNCS